MTQNSGEATIGLSATTAPALWAGRVMTSLFVLFMLFDVAIKLMRLPIVEDAMIQLGYPPGLGFPIGVLEAVLLVLYLIPRTAILGMVLFTGVFGGAIASHLRVGDPLFSHVLFGVYLGAVAWGGLWFRDASLRTLLPLRR
jgi:hypothetical protein